MPIVFEGTGSEIAAAAKEWIEKERAQGTRLFALEGLMSAGKTTTSKQVREFVPMLVRVELDNFLNPPRERSPRTWQQSLDKAHAIQHIKLMLRTHPVWVEGAICWPTAAQCGVPTRYIYLKRMQFPGFWADEHEITEDLEVDMLLRRSIRDHHAATRPWETADLVLERLIGEGGA